MSNSAYPADAPQLPLNGLGGHVDSNRSSRSNSIIRPTSSSSEDKKRFSNASSLATVTHSLDTSPPNTIPASHNLDQKFDPSTFQRDRLQGQTFPNRGSPGYYQPATSNNSASLPSQTDSPQFFYGQRPGGYEQYGGIGHGGQTQDNGEYPAFFTPAGDNSLMFSTNQS
jgi:hypothetical protein